MKLKALLGGLAALLVAHAAVANESEVKKALEPVLEQLFGPGVKADAVRKAGALNLYEIQLGGDILYTDEKVTYIINGNILDVKAKRDLTEERKQKLAQIKFSDLPLELAIKQVRGNGKRVLATFEDPNCSYCRKLAQELRGVNDVTVYTFILPILSPDSTEKAKNLWCAADRVKAWNELMIDGKSPAAGNCDHPADKVLSLSRKYGIRGTPTLFFADGSRVPGYMPVATLEKALEKGTANVK